MNNEQNNNGTEQPTCLFCKGGKMVCNACNMHRKCRIIRLVLGLFILLVVFMGGVKLGELKGELNNGIDRRDRNFRSEMPMMQMRSRAINTRDNQWENNCGSNFALPEVQQIPQQQMQTQPQAQQ